jgi:hypothetical protein
MPACVAGQKSCAGCRNNPREFGEKLNERERKHSLTVHIGQARLPDNQTLAARIRHQLDRDQIGQVFAIIYVDQRARSA